VAKVAEEGQICIAGGSGNWTFHMNASLAPVGCRLLLAG